MAENRGDEPTTEEGLFHPAVMYAYARCGFFITDINRHLVTPEQVAQWERAIDEWLADHPGEEGP